MEFRHLRTVAAVARHRSFTKAAEELYVAQSAISQQIRRLEAELGIEIFRRNSRSVELTEEGEVILAQAHRVLAEVDDLHNQLEELTGLLRGTVRIGGTYPFGPYDLYGVLAEFRGMHPGVSIHMVEDTQEEMLAMVREDELDCAFASVDPDAIGRDFAATLLWEDEFVAVSAVDHPFADRTGITFEQLAAEDLITHRDNSALRRRLEATLGKRGLEPRIAFVCTEMTAVRALASKGLGVAVLPRSVAEQDGPPIALRPFRPEPITWPVALVWRATRRQPPAAKAFLKLALARAEADAAGETEAPVTAELASIA
ncbi:MAG TPA: LysR family transcriptional regulator [Solirubrobacterales bacterium]|nr:LysR family transcriptional regulator [Solirubrobacterales bacterium]